MKALTYEQTQPELLYRMPILRKVGGIYFFRVWRIQLMFCFCRRSR